MTSGAVEDDKNISVVMDHQHHSQSSPPPFQGVPNYPPPPQQPQATGFPQPAQPSVEDDENSSVVTYHHHHHHQHNQPPPPPFYEIPNYPLPPQPQATSYPQPAQLYVPGYAVVGGIPVTEYHRRPCCGLSAGWVILIIGFSFIAIIWYITFFLELFSSGLQLVQDI